MSAELDAKWLELVAAGRAEWSPGMLARHPNWRGFRVFEVVPGVCAFGACRCASSMGGITRTVVKLPLPHRGLLPDWSDPATLGALLGQVRTRYMDPTIYARPQHVEDGHGWTLHDALGVLDLRGRPRSGPDEVSALLRGLELAP